MANFTTTTDDYDYTGDDDKICEMNTVREFLKLFAPITFSLIFVFGLIGNILVVITFSRYKKEKNMTDVYLLNMAIADILFIVTLPFWTVYYKQEWIFGDFMCKLVRSIYSINFSCSMLLLACVGIDRYVAIVQVTKSFRFRNTTLAYKRVLCLLVWFISASLSSITYVFSESYQNQGGPKEMMVCEPKYPKGSAALQWKFAAVIVEVGVGFLIPFLVMLFCYTFIIKTLLQAKNSQRHKAIHVIVTVVAVFLFCQIPYNVLLLAKADDLRNTGDCTKNIKYSYALEITKALAYFHCCLNPVIYAFIGVKFRNYFVRIMQDIWCMRKFYKSRARHSRLSSEMCTSRRTSEVFTSDTGSSFAI